MSTSKIESNGILCLENFLSESEILETNILKNDKYPSWDGDILIYKEANHNGKKDKLLGRVPVQVKASKRKWNKNESFSIDTSDLNNYFSDGGTLLIRPIFISTTRFRIFASVLLPVKIHSYLTGKNKKKSIKLTKITSLNQFEGIIKFFIENKKLQFNFDEEKSSQYLKDGTTEFVIKSFSNKPNEHLFFSDSSFVYIKEKHDLLIPTSLKLDSFMTKENVVIKIDDEVYFTDITRKHQRDSISSLILNSALRIDFNNGNLDLKIDITQNTIIEDISIAFAFIEKLSETQFFEFGRTKINCNLEQKSAISRDNFLYWNDVYHLLELCRFNSSKITVGDLENNREELLPLIGLLLKNETVKFNNTDQDIIIKCYYLYNKNIVLFFEKIPDGRYTGKNFIASDMSQIEVIVNEIPLKASKFLTLYIIFKTELPQYLNSILGFEQDMKEELAEYYDERLIDSYILLLLAFISSYDNQKLPIGLDIAEWLSKLILENCKDSLIQDILTVNLAQINKRKGKLDISQIRTLLKLVPKYSDRPDMLCCIYILLEDNDSFKEVFIKLKEDKKEELMSWPIWRLYKGTI